MSTVDRIIQTAKSKGISLSFLCNKLGLSSRTYFTDIKKNNREIPNDKLQIIAENLNVSIAYLKGETDTPTPITTNAVLLSPERTYNTADLSPQKQEIQTALDAMTPEQLEQIYSYIEFIKSQKK